MDGATQINDKYLLLTLLCAEIIYLLHMRQDIISCIKNKNQRTKDEDYKIKHGLLKSMLLETIVFVPLSAILFRFTIFPLIINKLLSINNNIAVWYSIMGVTSYGFPYISIKQFMITIARKTLKEFVSILEQHKEAQDIESSTDNASKEA